MEVCNWNWGAIASFVSAGFTGIAAVVAWKISEKWNNQKGSEVVADEAKESIKELLDNIFNTEVLISHIKKDNNIDLERFIKLREESNQLFKRIQIIDSSIQIESFGNYLENFNRVNKKILNHAYRIINNDYLEDELPLLIKEQELLSESNTQYCKVLIKKLRPYALFQTQFHFKITP